MGKQIAQLTRTALLIALAVLAQFLGNMLPGAPVIGIAFKQLVTGSLVNLVLVVSAGTVGLFPGMTVGLVSAILAQLMGFSNLPQMLPAIAFGNMAVVLVTWLFLQGGYRGRRGLLRVLGVLIGAAVKCAVIWSLAHYVVIPSLTQTPAEKLEAITFNFSWPQAVTALIGGLLALAVLPPLERLLKIQTGRR